jgi:SAM-dependent methyltransferase
MPEPTQSRLSAFMPQLTANAWLRFDSIRRAVREARPTSVLEIGAGQGALGVWLARRYTYTGIEPDATSRAAAVRRLATVDTSRIVSDMEELADERFDVVCAFEVLEHIDDDLAALRRWREVTSPAGTLVLSVPAHQKRFGPSDELAGHYRRYERRELEARLREAGFVNVDIRSHGFGLGYALERARNAFARRAPREGSLEERTSASGRYFQPRRPVTVVACALMAAPSRLLQAPFAQTDVGTGYVARARVAM